jgi:hypothetical protein
MRIAGRPKGTFLILDANWEVWVKHYAMLSSGSLAPRGDTLAFDIDEIFLHVGMPMEELLEADH